MMGAVNESICNSEKSRVIKTNLGNDTTVFERDTEPRCSLSLMRIDLFFQTIVLVAGYKVVRLAIWKQAEKL